MFNVKQQQQLEGIWIECKIFLFNFRFYQTPTMNC